MIIALILWSIVGLCAACYLYKDGYLDNINNKTRFVVAIICGPLMTASFLFGCFIGIIRVIIIILNKRG